MTKVSRISKKWLDWDKIDQAGHIAKEDDPQITELRKKIILEKGFLRKLYTAS